MQLALENNIRTIAFPSIATGIYRFPVDKAAEIAVRTVATFIKDNRDKFDMVKWVLFDDNPLAVYEKAVAGYYEVAE